MDTQNNLLDLFNEYFEVVPADTLDRLQECYRLRYQVYYEEGLFPGMCIDDYPEKLEYDEYDKRSKHCLLIYRPRGVVAGTVRIILGDRENLNEKFPLETIAEDLFFKDFFSHNSIQRSRLCEISRLILAPEFRARKGEKQKPYGFKDPMEDTSRRNKLNPNFLQKNLDRRSDVQRRNFPHAILGLFVGVVRMSVENNVAYWYGNMDPVCARLLKFFGINTKCY